MAGPGGMGGVNPVFASVVAQPFQAAALRKGEVLRGVVQSIEPQTLLRFGGLVVPVEKVEGLLPGQAVSAEVVQTGQGTQLRITPGPSGMAQDSTTGATSSAARDLSNIIVSVLQSMGKLEVAEQAVTLVPRAIAQNPAAVKLVLTLLLGRPDGDPDLQRVAEIVQRAVAKGVLVESDVPNGLPVRRGLGSQHSQTIVAALRHAAKEAQQPIAARLAAMLATGDPQDFFGSLSQDLPAALTQLAKHEEFAEFLRLNGLSADFRRAAEHLTDRLTAVQLINSRGSEVPYLFFALPMPADAPIRHAHIHVIGDGSGKAQKFDAKNATLVLDFSTANLGELWITLTVLHGACSCIIRARDLKAVEAIQAHATGLASGLAHAGYPGAIVQTTLWDGNPVNELATMMRRFKGLNVEA